MALAYTDTSSGTKLLIFVLFTLTSLISPISSARVSKEKVRAKTLFEYESYKHVQMFEYTVPGQAHSATWLFQANITENCLPRNVTIFLQQGSYPVINPNGEKFPDNFKIRVSSLHYVVIRSDMSINNYTVSHPLPGLWYIAAFYVKLNDKITQKGLAKTCTVMLESEVIYEIEENVIHIIPEVHSYQDIKLYKQVDKVQYYKFYVPSDTWLVSINVSRCSAVLSLKGYQCPIVIAASPEALPSLEETYTFRKNCTDEPDRVSCSLEFVPEEEAWHYIMISTLNVRVHFGLQVEYQSCWSYKSESKFLLMTELDAHDICQKVSKDKLPKRILLPMPHVSQEPTVPLFCRFERIYLEKEMLPGAFQYQFNLPEFGESNQTKFLEINVLKPPLISFDLDSTDVGGTLSFELALHPMVGTEFHNVSVVACLSHKMRSFPDDDLICRDGYMVHINTSSSYYTVDHVMIPFPHPGRWYVTFHVQCYITTELPITDGHLVTHQYTCQIETVKVFLGINSDVCLYGECGRYGLCYITISGTSIFSSCSCQAGYRGWGCTDDTFALLNEELLMSSLLLTLSNLLFIPAVFISFFRGYFAEGIAYFLTMFFSTFYHACDQAAYRLCIMRPSVLQFCDFYCGIMSFWLTIICMADLPPAGSAAMYVIGAIGIALGVEYDRTGLWVFVVPVCIAFVTMVVSWIIHCRKGKRCFPGKLYWFLCLLPGVLISVGGLTSYAMLETEDNYKYTHSAWHACMATAIIFLLPFGHKKKPGLYQSLVPSESNRSQGWDPAPFPSRQICVQ